VLKVDVALVVRTVRYGLGFLPAVIEHYVKNNLPVRRNTACPSFNLLQDKTNIFLSPNKQRKHNRVPIDLIVEEIILLNN
jgi:hypothetical protein